VRGAVTAQLGQLEGQQDFRLRLGLALVGRFLRAQVDDGAAAGSGRASGGSSNSVESEAVMVSAMATISKG